MSNDRFIMKTHKRDVLACLAEVDCWHTLLGVELAHLVGEGFDPDSTYTPLEAALRRLGTMLGVTAYEVREEARKMESG